MALLRKTRRNVGDVTYKGGKSDEVWGGERDGISSQISVELKRNLTMDVSKPCHVPLCREGVRIASIFHEQVVEISYIAAVSQVESRVISVTATLNAGQLLSCDLGPEIT